MKKMFVDLRPKLEATFVRYGEKLPRTFDQALSQQHHDDGLGMMIGKTLYHGATHTEATAATIRCFLAACPPFRAFVYAGAMSWFDLAVRDRHLGEKFQAGRNDLFMSGYLPYCNVFVTADDEQLKCLRKIAAVAKLQTAILSYDEFVTNFFLPAPCSIGGELLHEPEPRSCFRDRGTFRFELKGKSI